MKQQHGSHANLYLAFGLTTMTNEPLVLDM